MKRILLSILLAAAYALPAHAVYFGASAGIFQSTSQPYIAARLGSEVLGGDLFSHNLEAEVGYASDSRNGASANLMPVTLNYRARVAGGSRLGVYVGGGAGVARTHFSGYGYSESAWALASQVFAGISLKLSDNASLDFGARYLRISIQVYGSNIQLGHDTALEGGLHLKF